TTSSETVSIASRSAPYVLLEEQYTYALRAAAALTTSGRQRGRFRREPVATGAHRNCPTVELELDAALDGADEPARQTITEARESTV
uniref:Uncharacterized protein n=1 Tax=Plectus sambesii TaxID=2011161 RepID=A0A914VC66_9BILA